MINLHDKPFVVRRTRKRLLTIPTSQPINQSANQPINQLTNKPINQLPNQTPKGTSYALGFEDDDQKRDICFCSGIGKNEKFLKELNNTYHFFDRMVALEHPRYIMQYKARTKEAYIEKYIRTLRELI